MANLKVGVNLIEGTANSPVEGVSTAVSGIVGTFERGPVNVATLVTSMAQFESIFGLAPAPVGNNTSWYAVKAFFQKVGTGQLYVVRVASSAKVLATKTFDDRQVAPANTLRIDAINEGTWGNTLSVKVEDDALLTTTLTAECAAATQASLTSVEGLEVGSYVKFYNGAGTEYITVTSIEYVAKIIHWSGAVTNTYTIANGVITSLEFKLTVYVNDVSVETWEGLSMNDGVSFFCETTVNSDYIACVDLKASDTDYEDQPVAIAAQSLASGADGIADIEVTDWSGSQVNKTGLYAFDNVPTVFRIIAPNPTITTDPEPGYVILAQAQLAYCDARVTCQTYVEVPYGTSVADAVTWAANFSGRRIGCFFPWVNAGSRANPTWIPPSPFALGTVVEKDYRRGVHKSIGNERIAYGIDLEYHVSRAEGETLNDAGVNTLRKKPSGGLWIYGGRTLSATTNFRFLDASEYWNYVGRSLELATQWVPFELNDQTLWKAVERSIGDFLSNEQRRRALFDASNPGAQAWTVVMNESNNPADQVALGIASVSVVYVKTGTAEKFAITLTPSSGGLTVA